MCQLKTQNIWKFETLKKKRKNIDMPDRKTVLESSKIEWGYLKLVNILLKNNLKKWLFSIF